MQKIFKSGGWVLVALLAVILLPVLLRPRQTLSQVTDETLVVISPHNEAIRYEFGRAFMAAHKARTGRSVQIDWRTPGGTSEIARYLASEYLGAFQYYWEGKLHQPWNAEVQGAFDNPKVAPGDGTLAARARRIFLESTVGCGIDLMFGGGTYDFGQQAAAGRLVDSGVVAAHPELFARQTGSAGNGASQLSIPQARGGELYWDPSGRWIGATLAAFGICYNTDVLTRLGINSIPVRWRDLANPQLRGSIALSDPTQSGSAAKAFEMLIQEQIAAAGGNPKEGWDRAMRLIRRIAANARYFTDSAPKIPWDVESGDAAAGMVIDFYGRFQSEAVRRPDGSSRLGYVTPEGGSSFGADPIGMLRGAPSPALAREFIEFVMSPTGQKLWNWKVGTPDGPERYALRRLPILPALYAPEYARFRSDPGVEPFKGDNQMVYHPEWTGALFRPIAFAVQTMCIDSHDELREAWEALIQADFPPEATALFDDIGAVDYPAATGKLKPALGSAQKIDQVRLGKELCDGFRAQYRRVSELAQQRR